MAETVIKASDIAPGKGERGRGDKTSLGRIPALAPKAVLDQIQAAGVVEFTDAGLFDTVKAHIEAKDGVRLSEAKREGVTPDVVFDIMKNRLVMGTRQAAEAQQAGKIHSKVVTDPDAGSRTLMLSLAPIVLDDAETPEA